jgi:hypothetical protein
MKNLNKLLAVLTILAALLSMNVTASKISVVRSLPELASAETTFTVTLSFNVNESDTPIPSAVGLTEYYPNGWTVSNISSGGVDKDDRIEWVFSPITYPVQDMNITYVAHVPVSANGICSFSGSVLDMDETTGDDYITIVPYRITITRDLPSTAYTDSNITVYLNMDVSESKKPNALGLVEFFPLGWTVSNISSGGIKRNTSIEWIFSSLTSPVQDTNISYVLSVPSDANGTYQFSGQFNYSSTLGGVSQSTTGDISFFATDKCALIGDAPPCGVVEIPEVIDVITQWATGDATLDDVIAMINAWMQSI